MAHSEAAVFLHNLYYLLFSCYLSCSGVTLGTVHNRAVLTSMAPSGGCSLSERLIVLNFDTFGPRECPKFFFLLILWILDNPLLHFIYSGFGQKHTRIWTWTNFQVILYAIWEMSCHVIILCERNNQRQLRIISFSIHKMLKTSWELLSLSKTKLCTFDSEAQANVVSDQSKLIKKSKYT